MSKSKVTKGWHEVISDIKPHIPESWCEQQFGKRWGPIDNHDGVWTVFWTGMGLHEREIKYTTKYRYLFKNEKDAMLFTLRWL
jgi:hypothetical protein